MTLGWRVIAMARCRKAELRNPRPNPVANKQNTTVYKNKQQFIKDHLILSVIVINTVIAGRSPLPVGPASVATSAVN